MEIAFSDLREGDHVYVHWGQRAYDIARMERRECWNKVRVMRLYSDGRVLCMKCDSSHAYCFRHREGVPILAADENSPNVRFVTEEEFDKYDKE